MSPMPAIIPQELYRDIISNLSHDHDNGTRTLLSAAQCSWALRHEAQRVLFRHPFAFLWQNSDKPDSTGFSIIRSHEGFLEAILLAPSRLGPLVRSYNQSRISYNLKEPGRLAYILLQADRYHVKLIQFIGFIVPRRHREAKSKQGGHIFELMENALPHMTNLKTLYFATTDFLPTSPSILLQCNLRLEVMEWCNSGVESAVAIQLLSQQQDLRHLNTVEWGRFRKTSAGLEPPRSLRYVL
jgi:hypothetical protein